MAFRHTNAMFLFSMHVRDERCTCVSVCQILLSILSKSITFLKLVCIPWNRTIGAASAMLACYDQIICVCSVSLGQSVSIACFVWRVRSQRPAALKQTAMLSV